MAVHLSALWTCWESWSSWKIGKIMFFHWIIFWLNWTLVWFSELCMCLGQQSGGEWSSGSEELWKRIGLFVGLYVQAVQDPDWFLSAVLPWRVKSAAKKDFKPLLCKIHTLNCRAAIKSLLQYQNYFVMDFFMVHVEWDFCCVHTSSLWKWDLFSVVLSSVSKTSLLISSFFEVVVGNNTTWMGGRLLLIALL